MQHEAGDGGVALFPIELEAKDAVLARNPRWARDRRGLQARRPRRGRTICRSAGHRHVGSPRFAKDPAKAGLGNRSQARRLPWLPGCRPSRPRTAFWSARRHVTLPADPMLRVSGQQGAQGLCGAEKVWARRFVINWEWTASTAFDGWRAAYQPRERTAYYRTTLGWRSCGTGSVVLIRGRRHRQIASSQGNSQADARQAFQASLLPVPARRFPLDTSSLLNNLPEAASGSGGQMGSDGRCGGGAVRTQRYQGTRRSSMSSPTARGAGQPSAVERRIRRRSARRLIAPCSVHWKPLRRGPVVVACRGRPLDRSDIP